MDIRTFYRPLRIDNCAKQDKTMVTKDSKDATFDIGFGKRLTLTFTCVTAK